MCRRWLSQVSGLIFLLSYFDLIRSDEATGSPEVVSLPLTTNLFLQLLLVAKADLTNVLNSGQVLEVEVVKLQSLSTPEDRCQRIWLPKMIRL